MAISDNTRAVLTELQRNGVDPAILAGLERELDAKPNADKGISDGVLAQPAFNSYKARKEQEIIDLKNNLTKMASLTNAANNLDGDVQAEAQKQVLALREVFKAQGYDLAEVDEEVNKLLTDPSALQTLNSSKEPVINKEKETVPNQDLPNKSYVDPKTFADVLQTGLTNVAVGGIHVQAEMTRALREADRLKIELTDEQLNNIGNVVVAGAEKGKKPYEALEEHFGFKAVREANAKAQLDAQLLAAEEKGRREALKDRGVVIGNRDPNSTPNRILDRQRNSAGRVDSRIEKIEDLPKNAMGQTEVFHLRRHNPEQRREEHTANAIERYNSIRQKVDDEGIQIGILS